MAVNPCSGRPVAGVTVTHGQHDPARIAAAEILDKLRELNRREARCGLPPLHEQNIDRRDEVQRRLDGLRYVDDPPRVMSARELWLVIGAYCIAELIALDRAETLDIASGDEA